MTEQDIKRINELYHKSKTAEGLTEAEKEEQQRLRQAYIQAYRENMRRSLESIQIKEKDGTITSVKEEHDKKYGKKNQSES